MMSVGGLKSPREIGLKEIQKLAIRGINTIDKTKQIVGNIKSNASFFSFLKSSLLLY